MGLRTLPAAPPGVLSRGHRRLALAIALALAAAGVPLLPPAAPPAFAGDREDRAAERKKRQKEDEEFLAAAAAEWKASDHAGLAERLPEKLRVSLGLPDFKEGEYRLEHARAVLKDYFRARTFSKVERKDPVKDGVGTFLLRYARTDRKTVEATLYLTLGTEGKRRVLVKARETQ